VAIGVLALVAVAAAVVLGYVSADLQRQANEVWMTATGPSPDAAETERAEDLSTLGYSLSTFVAPLLLAAIVAVFAVLAVLTVAWERRVPPADPDSARPALGEEPVDAS
jgi:hypothetical protein